MTYREYLHKICTETDMDDKEDVTRLIQFLLQEAVEANSLSHRLEDKLKEVMSAKDFEEFVEINATEMSKEWLHNLPDSEFKDFALRNFDIIIDESKTFSEKQAEIKDREEI